MFFRVIHCVPDDSPIIGFLQTSPLSGLHKLQLGTATPESLKDWLANGYHSLISRTNAATNDDPKTYLKVVAQHADDNINRGEMIAFAEWELPHDVHVPKTGSDIEGTQPPGMNHAFAREMGPCLREMRDRVLRGKKCFGELHKQTPGTFESERLLTLSAFLLSSSARSSLYLPTVPTPRGCDLTSILALRTGGQSGASCLLGQ